MRSIRFPKMFSTNSTNVTKSSEYLKATKQNAILTLHCEKGELFGDPYFGLQLKHYLFDQNNYVLRDEIIDQIYIQLALFLPQIKIERSNIDIVQDREKGMLYCTFSGTNQIDYSFNTYSLILFDDKENQE